MYNYIEITPKKQVKSTLLKIMGDASSLFGNEVPYPQAHYFSKIYNRMVYCWYIEGYFKTNNNIKFLNDIIARFKITANVDLHSFKILFVDDKIKPYRLKAFQGLKSLANDKLKEKYQRVETRANDYVFWCLKLFAEDLIRRDGLIVYDTFESWAFKNFIDKAKDKSTLRAKCRSIYNWYFNRDWEIGRVKVNKTREEIMASRVEHAKKIHTKLANDTRRKVMNVITGIFANEYKKKDGSWNISKIAKDSGTTRPSVMKYLPKETLF